MKPAELDGIEKERAEELSPWMVAVLQELLPKLKGKDEFFYEKMEITALLSDIFD